jgi:hypothetical protein
MLPARNELRSELRHDRIELAGMVRGALGGNCLWELGSSDSDS